MKRSLLDRAGTGALLAVLALGAALMSAVFFLHLRHGPADGGEMARGRILPGLTLIAAGPDLVVTSIESGGPAARQGIVVGDAIVAIDGRPFHSLDQAEAYLVRARGDEIRLELRDGGRTHLVMLDRAGE